MDSTLTITKRNLTLTASYIKMNEEGRDVLDMVIQKLTEIRWMPKTGAKEKKRVCIRRK
ncbi:MAG: hypothetical protein LBH20_06530 [Treponema sp.]|jgi:hypothetical protein|nr:hypothetical protein [Treponema sp.]